MSAPELSPEYHAYIASVEWQAIRRGALLAAHNRCQVCNAAKSLDVHHRTYERFGREELSDLTVLCRSCHQLFHQSRRQTAPAKPKAVSSIAPKPRNPGLERRIELVTHVLQLGPANAYEIAALTGLKRSFVCAALEQMRKRKRVTRANKRSPWRLMLKAPQSTAPDCEEQPGAKNPQQKRKGALSKV